MCEPFHHSPRCTLANVVVRTILAAVALNRMFFLTVFYKWLHYILFSGFSVEGAEHKSRLEHFRFEKYVNLCFRFSALVCVGISCKIPIKYIIMDGKKKKKIAECEKVKVPWILLDHTRLNKSQMSDICCNFECCAKVGGS